VIPNFWLGVLVVIAGIFLVALMVLDFLGRREARAQDLLDETRRRAHLDAIVRGREDWQ